MKKILLLLPFLLITICSIAQSGDTLDVIYMKDGRILRGKIVEFDQGDGDITFRDLVGRTFFLTNKEYDYFKRDVVFEDRKKKRAEKLDTLYVRKGSEFGFYLAPSISAHGFSTDLTYDDYFIETDNTSYGHFYNIPLSMNVGFGKYFNNNFYVGLDAKIGVVTSMKPYTFFGVEGRYYYDKNKRNIASYINTKIGYQTAGKIEESFHVADTTFHSETSYSYPGYEKAEFKLSGVNISIGQGFEFYFADKRSFLLEASLFKYFVTSYSGNIKGHVPNMTYSSLGINILFGLRF